MNMKISKNERYLNILEQIFQLLKETQEYLGWVFQRKRLTVSVITTMRLRRASHRSRSVTVASTVTSTFGFSH